MSDTSHTEEVKREVRTARADLHRDFAELDHQLHVDVPERIREHAPLIAAGAAVLGALIGFGGAKNVKRLLAIGIPAAAAALYFRRRRPPAPTGTVVVASTH